MSKKEKYIGQYLEDLNGDTCQCGNAKKPGKALCPFCYHLLPVQVQAELWNRIGRGYRRAYDQAMEILLTKKSE